LWFNVVETVWSGHLPGPIATTVGPLPLQQTEPACHYGIVVTIASAGHGAFDPKYSHQGLEITSGVLVGLACNKSTFWRSTPGCH